MWQCQMKPRQTHHWPGHCPTTTQHSSMPTQVGVSHSQFLLLMIVCLHALSLCVGAVVVVGVMAEQL